MEHTVIASYRVETASTMKFVTEEPGNVPMVVSAVSVVLHAKHVGNVISVYLYLSVKMCSHSVVVKQFMLH